MRSIHIRPRIVTVQGDKREYIPQVVTKDRALEIIEAAKAQAEHGPWSDQLRKVMLPEERAYIHCLWDTMPGTTCFLDALFLLSNGVIEAENQRGELSVTIAVSPMQQPPAEKQAFKLNPVEPLDDLYALRMPMFDPLYGEGRDGE